MLWAQTTPRRCYLVKFRAQWATGQQPNRRLNPELGLTAPSRLVRRSVSAFLRVQIAAMKKASKVVSERYDDPLRKLPPRAVPSVDNSVHLYSFHLPRGFHFYASDLLWGNSNPGVEVESVTGYVNDLLTALLARVQLNGGDVSQLKEVLGDEFAKYKEALDKRVAAVVRANQEAKAAQEEEEARRAEEERRREEARRQREEFEREYREAHPDYLEHSKL